MAKKKIDDEGEWKVRMEGILNDDKKGEWIKRIVKDLEKGRLSADQEGRQNFYSRWEAILYRYEVFDLFCRHQARFRALERILREKGIMPMDYQKRIEDAYSQLDRENLEIWDAKSSYEELISQLCEGKA